MSVEQAQAVLFGLALGDTLGWPVEFMRLDEIRRQYGADGIQHPPPEGPFTDDTQMTIATAESLIEVGSNDVDQIMAAVGARFVEWLHSPENNRAPGNACISGVRRFEQGFPWRESGIAVSKGCGSAMRVAPLGYYFQHDPDSLRDVARASSLITHGHPTALAASIGAAYLVKLALDGVPASMLLNRLFVFTEGLSDEFDQALRRVGQVLGWGDEVAAMRQIGEGWVGEEAVALALYCVMRHPDDYVGAMQLAVNIDGDSDSVGCIAGGIMGAALGLDAIPLAWREQCEKSAYVADLGRRLAASRDTYLGGAW